MNATATLDRRNAVVDCLVGQSCAHCESGELVRGSFKGNVAVVCEECDAPTMRLF